MSAQQSADIFRQVLKLLDKNSVKVKSRASARGSTFSTMEAAAADFGLDELAKMCSYLDKVDISTDWRTEEQREYDEGTLVIFELMYVGNKYYEKTESTEKFPEDIYGRKEVRSMIESKAKALQYRMENRPKDVM